MCCKLCNDAFNVDAVKYARGQCIIVGVSQDGRAPSYGRSGLSRNRPRPVGPVRFEVRVICRPQLGLRRDWRANGRYRFAAIAATVCPVYAGAAVPQACSASSPS